MIHELFRHLYGEGVSAKYASIETSLREGEKMSQAALREFLPQILLDAKLQDQLKNTTDKAAFMQSLRRLGTEHGFDFTDDDVDAVLMKNKANPLDQLSEAQRRQIATARPAATSDGCGSAWTTLFGPC